jgi:hypothetical protein
VLSVSAVTIRLKTEKELQALLREAESELDAAIKRSELNLAARKLMQAKRALKLIQPQVLLLGADGPPRPF